MNITVVHKTPEPPPIERIVLELSPEEAAYIRWLAARVVWEAIAERLYNKLDIVKSVSIEGSRCFL